jgi:hypothetical protein
MPQTLWFSVKGSNMKSFRILKNAVKYPCYFLQAEVWNDFAQTQQVKMQRHTLEPPAQLFAE